MSRHASAKRPVGTVRAGWSGVEFAESALVVMRLGRPRVSEGRTGITAKPSPEIFSDSRHDYPYNHHVNLMCRTVVF
jgi:hypothetical protein